MKNIFIYGDRSKRQNYIEALEACGARVTVSLDPAQGGGCHALLVPGGGDIDPSLYGAENRGSQGVDRQLDLTELDLVRSFADAHKPILGICRGLQVINVAFGGALVQHLPTAAAHCWEESTGDKQHFVRIEPNSFLSEIYRPENGVISVNSAHHQGADGTAPGFRTAAQALDGVMEALEAPAQRIYAVQWHPERMTLRHARPDTVDGIEVFRFFLSRIG